MTKNFPTNYHGEIVIIDDTPANLHLLANLLKESGYTVRPFPSGKLALAGIKHSQPDLILLDIQMPNMDGYQVCEQLKTNEINCDIPVIFISALNEGLDKFKAFSVGGIDYITKPFQAEEVLARVNTHLQLSSLQKMLKQENYLQAKQLESQNAQLQLMNKALQKVNQELKLKYNQLQQAQLQLIQSEKMAILGQLVAGIAHEINNPVSFVYGNLEPANQYAQDLLQLIELYQKYYPQPPEEIQNEIESIELDFMKVDFIKLLNSMEIGAERISEIVLSLRNFSRLDESELKKVDIHEGINSTLMILHNRLKAKPSYPEIQVIKEYGNLPLVNCYVGKLNQVFMNILANAIDELDSHNLQRTSEEIKTNPSYICISTEVTANNWIIICISDNGSGISEDVMPKLFDPFFTTKDVGKGTGLGLSISYQIIVEEHGGKLSCRSIPGEGAEFIIEIPVTQF